MGVDPWGLEVVGFVNLKKGIISIQDIDTRDIATVKFFSGGYSPFNQAYYQSIPKGRYYINNITKPNYFRLTAIDSYIDDYVDWAQSNYNPDEKMSAVRLHLGVESHACITVSNQAEWNKLKRILMNTRKGKTTFGNGEVFERRGVIEVFGEGEGDQSQRP